MECLVLLILTNHSVEFSSSFNFSGRLMFIKVGQATERINFL